MVRDVSPEMASKIKHPGVVIQSVRTGSFADLQGLERGYVIIRINKMDTGNRDQFNIVVNKLKVGDDVVFEIVDPRHPELGPSIYVGVERCNKPASNKAYGVRVPYAFYVFLFGTTGIWDKIFTVVNFRYFRYTAWNEKHPTTGFSFSPGGALRMKFVRAGFSLFLAAFLTTALAFATTSHHAPATHP